MKKQLLRSSLFLLSGFISVSTFAQIANSGFETWSSHGAYSTPDNWGTMNNTTAMQSVYTCTKGTPGSPGSYYLNLTSKTVGSGVVNGIAVSGKLDTMTMQPKSGFAFNQRPQNFTGKWQHMISGSSQGSISVTLTRWDNSMGMRTTVATASQTLSGMAMSWANFTINFTYQDGNNPDTCIIVMKASGSSPANGDYLYVDNLAFSGSVTGIENHGDFPNDINVYPNPAINNVNIAYNLNQSADVNVTVLNMLSEKVNSISLGTQAAGKQEYQLNVGSLSKGVYFIKLNAGEVTETTKISVVH